MGVKEIRMRGRRMVEEWRVYFTGMNVERCCLHYLLNEELRYEGLSRTE